MENKEHIRVIIDYKTRYIDTTSEKQTLKTFTKKNIILVREDGVEIQTDYIKITIADYKRSIDNAKEETLDLINKIYPEISKLKLLGSGYPIYKIGINLDNELSCKIIDFNFESKLKNYTVKKFVTAINLPESTELKLEKITLKNPITITSLGKTERLEIEGIENLKNLKASLADTVAYTVSHHYDGELRLKYLESCTYTNDNIGDIQGIHKIILENTCQIEDIPMCLFRKLVDLELVILSKSVKTINHNPIHVKLEKDTEGYYVPIYRTHLNKYGAVRVKYNTN